MRITILKLFLLSLFLLSLIGASRPFERKNSPHYDWYIEYRKEQLEIEKQKRAEKRLAALSAINNSIKAREIINKKREKKFINGRTRDKSNTGGDYSKEKSY